MNLNEVLNVQKRPEFIDVEIPSVRVGADERPLLVRVARPDRRLLTEAVRVLPAQRPKEPKRDGADPEEHDVLAMAERVIPGFAAVQAPDGTLVCPAFSFATPPDPELIDGAQLSFADVEKLTLAIMWMGGYGGGAATTSFLGVGRGSVGSS